MSETKQAYPLQWPSGWKRISSRDRKNGRFSRGETRYSAEGTSSWRRMNPVTVSDGVTRCLKSLESMGISRNDVVISTNVRTRLDGLPRSGEKEPDDPGAAVYWRKNSQSPMRCMAIDSYLNVADNLSAIAATLEAMRAIERHGGAEILDRAFTGFAALPANASRPWRDVLEFDEDETPNPLAVDTKFKALAMRHHPDRGGSREKFEAIVEARKHALQELAG